MNIYQEITERIIQGGEITKEEAVSLLKSAAPRDELHEAAHKVTEALTPKRFDLCGIVNAKCGLCSENCKWCAQSAHWKTGCETFPWIGAKACLKAAQEAEAKGATRFGLVTSGRALDERGVTEVCEALQLLRQKTHLHLCASLGILSKEQIERLQEAGLEWLHCNIETAPSYFPNLCTTHTVEEKIATLKHARELGLKLCCGGIIGMGETDEQLVEFAFALKEIAPDSIPVNVLHPIPGTPLYEKGIPEPERVLDAVAILRLVNPRTPLRFAGGRRDMSDETAKRCIYVGMSAGIVGPLLTTPGGDYDDDRHLAALAGYDVSPDLTLTDDERFEMVAKSIMERHRAAFEELAK